MLDDLLTDRRQRRLSRFLQDVVTTMTVVGNDVAEDSGGTVIGDICLDAECHGVSPVVHVPHRFRGENRGIGAHGNAHIDEIRVVMQRSRVRNFETIKGEGREHGVSPQ